MLTPYIMSFEYFLLLVLLTVSISLASSMMTEENCAATGNEVKPWRLSIIRLRNESGEWMDFSIVQDWENPTRKLKLDVKETMLECGGKKMIRLQGILQDPYFRESHSEKLRFHFHTGSNTALTNKGYTAKKLKLDGSGVVITNRPLKINEIFEVKLDNRTTARGWGNGIGITTLDPETGKIPDHMNSLKVGTWMLYGKTFWKNGVEAYASYGATDIYRLKAGERMGVMRSDTGALHFFVNGVDQGPVDSNIPEIVYGVYELWGDATQATIVHHD